MSFPGNVVDVLSENLIRLPSPDSATSVTVVERPVRPTDPNYTVGIVSNEWVPGEFEIGGFDPEPAFARYTYWVQAQIKHAQEGPGRAMHSAMSKSLRSMLYRDPEVRVALRGLSDSEYGITERANRYGLGRQRFLSNRVGNAFLFVSSLDLWVEVVT